MVQDNAIANMIETDVLVIGAGGAGMRAAYEAHLEGAKVLIAVKGRFGAIAVRGAGGTAAALSERGSMRGIGLPNRRQGDRLEPEQALEDIIQCGLGMADRRLVRIVVDEALDVRRTLESWGMAPTFTEGYGVNTHGVPIVATLQSVIRKSGVAVRERTAVTDLLVRDGACVGAMAVDELTGEVLAIKARAVVLATGGISRIFPLNFHPSCITGDGQAMGYLAGAELFNMEFHQIFIGTVFPNINLTHSWLWESYPRLFNVKGEEFLQDYLPEGATVKECLEQRRQHHPFSSRDSLSRYLDLAIIREVKQGRGTPRRGVFVEITDPSYRIRPDLLEWYHYRGVHWDRGPVEIGVCHHCCNGGLRIDEHGQTSVPGLFAAGEIAAGPHGADRLGGGMLLASQVFGRRAGRQAARYATEIGSTSLDAAQLADLAGALRWPRGGRLGADQVAARLRAIAWDELLCERSGTGLRRALREIAVIRDDDLPQVRLQEPGDLVRYCELRKGLLTAEIVARASLAREESRGGHYRTDFPEQDDAHWLKAVTIARRGEEMVLGTRVIDPEWKPRDVDMLGQQWG